MKTIPGASDELLAAAGYLADRISVNLELPTEESLRTLAPNKTMKTILNPMGKVQNTIAAHRMAIGKTLSDRESMPIVLDDTFSMYDPERLLAVFRWLKKSGSQVILFTSRLLEAETAEKVEKE